MYEPPPAAVPERGHYHGPVTHGLSRLGVQATTLANEVIQYLEVLSEAKVRITIEIDEELPEGASASVVRAALRNSKTLKFSSSECEYA